MPTPPVAIDALPAAPNPDSDEVAFDNAAWNWASALPNFRSQFNAASSITYTNAQEAVAAANTAVASAATATTQAGIATTQAGISTGKAAEASASADAASAASSSAASSATAAANSAAAAAALAGAFIGTSATVVAIGAGNKSFTTQAGELYTPGVFLTAVSQANSANFMFGQVVSYNSGTGALVLGVQATGGSGTFADWNLSLTGAQGAQGIQGLQGLTGGVNGGQMLAALDELKAANIAAAATTNVWSITGNSATLIGATTINSFGTAPQAGAKRTLIAASATPLTNSANLILPGGANFTTAAGDRLEIYAETTTQHRVTIFKANGTPVKMSGGATYTPRTANAQLTNADKGLFVDITSGTFTQTIDAVGTLDADWYVWLRNSGSGDVTIPSSDGVTNWKMYPGEARLLMRDGADFKSCVVRPFYKVFTASGNFIKPPGYQRFAGRAIGAGGGGAGSAAGWRGGAGGGGQSMPFSIAAVLFAASEVVTVGAGGPGSTTTATSGGNTTIGTLVTGFGGTRGMDLSGSSTDGAGGSGGGLVTYSGQYASSNNNNTTSDYGGGKGGNGTSGVGQAGGSSVHGAGGGGSGADSGTPAGGTSTYAGAGGNGGVTGGSNGTAPGGGGGGTRTGTGGSGARGELQIWGEI